jgi:glutathione S-transferase
MRKVIFTPKIFIYHQYNHKGAAELCRILFKINDIEFEDFRFPIKIKEGGGFETPEFDEYKKNGILAANMGRAPLLITNTGVSIGQSKSIERYICRQCKMLGDGEEEALIDCIAENIRDIRDKWGKVRMIGGMGSNPEKEAAIKKFYESELSEWLEKLENSLPKSDSEFAVGTRLSYADIQIWYLMTEVFDKDKVVAASSEKCIRLKAITNNVSKNQNLQKWLEARPQTMF